MSYVIDRRLNARNKSTVNRQRFLKRYRAHIQKAVSDAVDSRSITDMERGEQVVIPAKDISEPTFGHGPGGVRSVVHPGNRKFIAGDRIEKPGGGGAGSGEGDASNSGEGLDDFAFTLTEDEFLGFLFEDLELPNLTKRRLKGDASFEFRHGGYVSDGIPARLSVVRSMQAAKMRKLALTGDRRRQLREAERALDEAQSIGDEVGSLRHRETIADLERQIARVPFLDPTDLRYRLVQKKPVPTSQAVMFCLMDVSGSMDQHIKDLAKRFYLLLYLFLKRHYQRTEIVFIRHHTVAKEVDEQEFFYSRETGGTVVSSALKLMAEIIDDRYSPNEWNIYGAQASDGDNWNDDSPICRKLLAERILPAVQYFAYVEITKRAHQALWREYEQLAGDASEYFAQRQIREAKDIFPVFHELFQKRDAA